MIYQSLMSSLAVSSESSSSSVYFLISCRWVICIIDKVDLDESEKDTRKEQAGLVNTTDTTQ